MSSRKSNVHFVSPLNRAAPSANNNNNHQQHTNNNSSTTTTTSNNNATQASSSSSSTTAATPSSSSSSSSSIKSPIHVSAPAPASSLLSPTSASAAATAAAAPSSPTLTPHHIPSKSSSSSPSQSRRSTQPSSPLSITPPLSTSSSTSSLHLPAAHRHTQWWLADEREPHHERSTEMLAKLKSWGRQVIEVSDTSFRQNVARASSEQHELEQMNLAVSKQQEKADMAVDAIAAVFDTSTRRQLKKQHQVTLMRGDHALRKELHTANLKLFDDLYTRSLIRRMRIRDEFCSSWEVLNFLGDKMNNMTSSLLTSLSERSSSRLQKLKRIVPSHLLGLGDDGVMAQREPDDKPEENKMKLGKWEEVEARQREKEREKDMEKDYEKERDMQRDEQKDNTAPTKLHESSSLGSLSHSHSHSNSNSNSNSHSNSQSSLSHSGSTSALASSRPLHTVDNSYITFDGCTITHSAAPAMMPAYITARCAQARGMMKRRQQPLNDIMVEMEELHQRDHIIRCIEHGLFTMQSTLHLPRGKFNRRKTDSTAYRLNTLCEELTRFGYVNEALSLKADETVTSARRVASHLLTAFAAKTSHHARFYFEIHCASPNTTWFAGWAVPELTKPVDFYSTSQTTFALHSEGYLFCSGTSRRLPAIGSNRFPSHSATGTVGIAIDLDAGTISCHWEGRNTTVLFGVGASAFSDAEQKTHGDIIRSATLVPCVGLLGPRVKLIKSNEKERERERERERQRESEKNEKDRRRRDSKQASSLHERDRDSEDSDASDSSLINTARHSVPSSLTSQQPLIGWVVPKLSVNLGEFDFAYLPPDHLAVNLAEPPAEVTADADASLTNSFTAYQALKHTKLSKQTLLSRINALKAKTTLTKQETAQLQIDEQRYQLLSRPSPLEFKQAVDAQKSAFFKGLTTSRLVSWSQFPPQSVRVQQAILKVQRMARRFINFKQRRARYEILSVYAIRIQRAWRLYRRNKNKALFLAVMPIQRVWRGYKARKLMRLLKKYNISYEQARKAAVQIQSFIRMLIARKKVMVLATIVQQKIEHIKSLVVFVQRMFRRKVQNRTVVHNKSTLSACLLFQSRIRGIRLRRLLAQIDPNAAKQLKAIASSVTAKQQRWAAVCLIQRVWRGYVARRYVKTRRNVVQRDITAILNAWRAYLLRQRIDRHYRSSDAVHIKTFFSALGYFGEEQ